MKKVKSIIKYLTSYFKSNWEFGDYPLEIWENEYTEENGFKFRAKFTNWHTMVAFGSSPNEAIENLRIDFVEYAKQNKLPRPGTSVNFEFAESSRIQEYEDIAVDFFEKIIEIDYFDCYISDFSSLYDFDLNNSETIEKIKIIYGVEPDSDLILVDIFEQIKNKASC